jgi:uncharacterized repeat protein (TIGR03803 family)
MRSQGACSLFAVCLAVLFSMGTAQAATKYKILHGFGNGKDGGGLFGGVALDANGNLYGMTWSGGAYGMGTVFELSPGSNGKWNETILHSFCRPHHCTDGALPSSTPALDAAGNLYGSSDLVFQMTPGSDGWKFTVIWTGLYGGDLLLDAAGNLYGSFGAGKYKRGAVSELLHGPSGWKEKDLYSFCRQYGCPDGDGAEGRLAWDGAGNLYGISPQGGKRNGGLVFQLVHTGGTWKEHVLHNFVYDELPKAGVTLDSAGNVYGSTTQGGQYYDGTIYRLSPQKNGTWKYTILYDFPDYVRNGAGPIGQMVFDTSGNLYGATSGGGKYQLGTVFELSPSAGGKWTHRVLHAFKYQDGEIPYAGLAIDSQGHLYGTTSEGGPNNAGVVYEITP